MEESDMDELDDEASAKSSNCSSQVYYLCVSKADCKQTILGLYLGGIFFFGGGGGCKHVQNTIITIVYSITLTGTTRISISG